MLNKEAMLPTAEVSQVEISPYSNAAVELSVHHAVTADRSAVVFSTDAVGSEHEELPGKEYVPALQIAHDDCPLLAA